MSTQDMHALVTTPAQLLFSGTHVRIDGDMVCLTDMWRAAGADDAKRPARWREQDTAIGLVEFLEESGVVLNDSGWFRVVRSGGNDPGSTFAHWQLAMAYAKYLSPEFHAWCNTVVRGRMTAPKAIALPSRTEFARMLLAESERADKLEAEVKLLAPKADFYDQVAESTNTTSIAAVAKTLGYGRNRFFNALRGAEIIEQNSALPRQEHLDAGRFVVVSGVHQRTAGPETHFTAKVTGKGFVYLAKRFGKKGVTYLFPAEEGGQEAAE